MPTELTPQLTDAIEAATSWYHKTAGSLEPEPSEHRLTHAELRAGGQRGAASELNPGYERSVGRSEVPHRGIPRDGPGDDDFSASGTRQGR